VFWAIEFTGLQLLQKSSAKIDVAV